MPRSYLIKCQKLATYKKSCFFLVVHKRRTKASYHFLYTIEHRHQMVMVYAEAVIVQSLSTAKTESRALLTRQMKSLLLILTA